MISHDLLVKIVRMFRETQTTLISLGRIASGRIDNTRCSGLGVFQS